MRVGRASRVVLALAVGLGAMGLVGRLELAHGGLKPIDGRAGVSSSQAGTPTGVADSLEQAFMHVAQNAGPAVVSISTEQIEQVQRYFRVHPFFGPQGQEPFEEFFREFFGEVPSQGPSQEFRRFGLGSGVIIDEDGLILTNEHVVAEADKITVTLADGREFSGEVKGKDPRSDLAIVKIDAKKLPAARLGDSGDLRTGQWAIALGNPFGMVGPAGSEALGTEPTLTVGVISALHRRLPRVRADRDYSDLIQTDAAINPGNSGGPLLNLHGEVIGINVAILTSSRGFEGVGFAIPIDRAKEVLQALIEGRRVLYGWLGVQIQDITPDVGDYYGLEDRQGVLVYQVLPEGPAQRAGLQDGDIIKAFAGEPVHNARELVAGVGRAKVGDKAPVEILREGKRMTVEVQVGERPGESDEAIGAGEAWRGLQVAEVSPELAERFGVEAGTPGVLITEVAPDSPAAEARLQPGDLINEINRLPIQSLSAYRQAIAKVQGNALVRTTRGYVVVKAGR
jgi:serine protease Do